MSDAVKNTLLGVLAAVAVGTSAYAVWSVNHPPGTGSSAAVDPEAPVEPAQTTAPVDPAPTTTEPEVVTEEPEEGLTTAEWLAALEGGADLLVIGDGYSNLPSQWLQEWGSVTGAERPVAIRHWGEADDLRFNAAIELSTGPGEPLTIWSASRDESTITEAVERLDRFDSASSNPEAVLVSLGQASGEEDIPAGLDALLEGLPEVPVLLVVGPADLYDPGVGDAFAAWGAEHTDRVVTVDLRESLGSDPTAEEWAQAFQAALADS